MVVVLSPANGLRTRNHTITLWVNFSEPPSKLCLRQSRRFSLECQQPTQNVTLHNDRDGHFTAELRAVDRVGNVQSNATFFSWEIDTSKFPFI